eukprot:Rmarinus@m.12247
MAKKPVDQLLVSNCTNRLIILCDGNVSMHDMKTLEVVATLAEAKGASVMSIKAKEKAPDHMCVCVKRKIVLVEVNARGFTRLKEFAVPEPVSALYWLDHSIVCGYKRIYTLLHDITGEVEDLFPLDKTSPAILPISSKECMLLAGNVGVVIDSSGQASRPSVEWSKVPYAVTGFHPFVVSCIPKKIEVYSLLSQNMFQTMAFDKDTGGAVQSQTVDASGTIFLGTAYKIFYLKISDPKQIIVGLIKRCKISEAFAHFDVFFGKSGSPEAKELEKEMHALAGFALFESLVFNNSVQHFLQSNVNGREICAYFPSYLSDDLKYEPVKRDVGFGGMQWSSDVSMIRAALKAKAARSESAQSINFESAQDSLLREAKRAAARILSGLRLKRKLEGMERVVVDTVLLKLLVDNRATTRASPSVTAQSTSSTATLPAPTPSASMSSSMLPSLGSHAGAMVAGAASQAGAMVAGAAVGSMQAVKGLTKNITTTLRGGSSGTRASMSEETGKPAPEVEAAFEPAIIDDPMSQMLEELVADPENQCSLDDCVAYLSDNHCYRMLGQLYASRGQRLLALETWQKLGTGELIEAGQDGVQETIDFLCETDDFNVITQFSQWLLERYPEKALIVFTKKGRSVPLPTTRTLELLQKHGGKELVVGYLEYVTAEEASNSHYHTSLAIAYLDAVIQSRMETSAAGRRISVKAAYVKKRNRLQRFLRSSNALDTMSLLDRVLEYDLHEEAVILYGKAGQYENALRTLVFTKGDCVAAERFCESFPDTLPEAEQRHTKVQLCMTLLRLYFNPSGEASDVPIYWTRAVEFLSQHVNDLNPAEVVELLPPAIPLHVVKDYLVISSRNMLHERRSGQIVKSLSKLENVNVHCQALDLRSRAIAITHTRRCPVCQRLIGGKVFVAFPNGEIVHHGCRQEYIKTEEGKAFTVA